MTDNPLRLFASYDPTCHGADGCTQRLLPWFVTTGLADPQSCYQHLTPEQREAYDHAYDDVHTKLDRLQNEPECWSWPTLDLHEYPNAADAAEALRIFQHGRGCAICGDKGALVTDHDHGTGMERGKLCHACNIQEGMGYATPPFVKYRQRHPASILGVEVRYCSPFFGEATADPPMTVEERGRVKAAADLLTLPGHEPEPLPQEGTTK